jgi:hypothetical protein
LKAESELQNFPSAQIHLIWMLESKSNRRPTAMAPIGT